jgi:hypothetical protein
MFMIDILRLPGVEEARGRLLDDGAYFTVGPSMATEAFVNSIYVDDLIRAVVEAMEEKAKRERSKRDG